MLCEQNKIGKYEVLVEHLLANTPFFCRVFDVKTKESRSTCWIAQDCLGPFTAREQGEDENGPFEYTLTEHQENR